MRKPPADRPASPHAVAAADFGKTLLDQSVPGRCAGAQLLPELPQPDDIAAHLLRHPDLEPHLPEVSELQVVRHFTGLSQKNFSIDTQFYPLGSCTMKYNPRGAHRAANLPGFANRHPLAPEALSQGVLSVLYQLQELLAALTGMSGVSLTPMAGAQGELAGIAMMRAYHEARGDHQRREILVPEAAHGTNPATASMCGYQVRELAVDASGDVALDDLTAALGPQTAGIMLTNPSTCGLFERHIGEIARQVHQAGGLLYYDGANLNAICGKVRPGDMGFDVLHLNLHKTFATPHGGGGPGAGPVGAGERLLPYLPTPWVTREHRDADFWQAQRDLLGPTAGTDQAGYWYSFRDQDQQPCSIGHLSSFMGNVGILVRALAYALMLGREGLRRIAEFSTLNSNYLARRLVDAGFELAWPERRMAHEFVLTFTALAKSHNVTAMDLAKRLLDFGMHPPTTYFPLIVPECWLVEPTETETMAELDRFVAALIAIDKEARTDPERLREAPFNMPVARLDEVGAARSLDLTWAHSQAPAEPARDARSAAG